MSVPKKKPPALPRHSSNDQVNKKALIWIGAVFVVIVAAVAVLLALKI
jgi:hypothetical protein